MKILAGIDGGPQQQATLTLATRLTGEDDELVVAAVRPAPMWSEPMDSPIHHAVGDEQALIDRAHEQLGRRDARMVVVADDHPAKALVRLARAEQADLMVIGSAHRGRIGRALLGGTGDQIVQGAPCAIVVAPRDFAPTDTPVRRIAVAFDGSAESDAALEAAQDLAERYGASLTVLSVLRLVELAITPPSPYAYAGVLEESRDRLQEIVDRAVARVREGIEVEGRIMEGAPAAVLAEAAEEFDLMVAGSRGHGTLATVVLGSVTRPLLHDAPCPLVVVPRSAIAERPSDAPVPARDSVA